MPSLAIHYKIPVFKDADYRQAIIDYMKNLMKEAAAEFAKAALARIPIRTGFVAGSFAALSALLGDSARLNPIVSFTQRILRAVGRFLKSEGTGSSRSSPNTGPKYITNEYYYPPSGGRVLKTPTSGQQFATKPEDIILEQAGKLIFNFMVDITYFSISDVNPSRSPTAPWHAFEAGTNAFLNYISNNIKKGFPKIQGYIQYVPA